MSMGWLFYLLATMGPGNTRSYSIFRTEDLKSPAIALYRTAANSALRENVN